MKIGHVLSLFDGMSCGQIALNRANIEYDNYYASEIDKHAITVTQANYPKTIQLGDVNKWPNWSLPKIDLLIGGSPCQGFSFAGKKLNFKDPRSSLFFKFVDVLGHYKPRWFLLENVKMKKQYQDTISQYLGVDPILINSNLVSAQNRQRLYWTNIPNILLPSDRKIFLKDIIEYGITDRDKSFCIDANYHKGGNLKSYFQKHRRQLIFDSTDQLMIYQLAHGDNKGGFKAIDGKTPSMTTSAWHYNNLLTDSLKYRILTPIECERLQTVPDNYTNYVSKTSRYKMLGNGWTVDVVAHILGHI